MLGWHFIKDIKTVRWHTSISECANIHNTSCSVSKNWHKLDHLFEQLMDITHPTGASGRHWYTQYIRDRFQKKLLGLEREAENVETSAEGTHRLWSDLPSEKPSIQDVTQTPLSLERKILKCCCIIHSRQD